ncbi:DUF3298 domain-containing protein [Stutzerimonas tarimensis]|uniref:DUF3298 domain-containing protein n=1 Tax=Stutzerimonas tarimensis TaxID=1507735 RepID=A0ABV7T3F5_9GAMM
MSSSPFIPLLGLVALALSLAACQRPPADQPPVAFERSISETRSEGCDGEHCPLVNIDVLRFPGEPELERLIDRRLRQLARHGDEPIPPSLEAHRQAFLASARDDWSSWLQAAIRDWHGQVLVIELSSYRDLGDTTGHPGRGFINYDRAAKRELRLQDALLPGREGAFWRLAEQAHRDWVRQQHPERIVEFRAAWPFRPTPHIALLRDRVLLKYDVRQIAPYDNGHPEISVPHSRLTDILRPEFLR